MAGAKWESVVLGSDDVRNHPLHTPCRSGESVAGGRVGERLFGSDVSETVFMMNDMDLDVPKGDGLTTLPTAFRFLCVPPAQTPTRIANTNRKQIGIGTPATEACQYSENDWSVGLHRRPGCPCRFV